MIEPLPPAPANLAARDGRLLTGLWAGEVRDDPVRAVRQRGGRVRRWSYAAAGDENVRVGAAVVNVGIGATVFVWCNAEARCWTWERTVIGGRGITVPARPSAAGGATAGDGRVTITADGGLRIDVPVEGSRLSADLRSEAARGTGAVCATHTPRGGWNVTRKQAGYEVTGTVAVGRERWELSGGGWRDWTAGRQDRHTSWRWAAGAGTTSDGVRVGLNLSTGMNEDAGENVVWWDGVPFLLPLQRLEPVAAADGSWRLAGPGWELAFEPYAVRAADENLLVMRSRYVQPIGLFAGALPGPDGTPVQVRFPGVTEDHHARW